MTKTCFQFGPSGTDGDASMTALLGGKGANLAEMAKLGIPVPPGFTLTTAVCLRCATLPALPDDVRADIESALARVEAESGRRFGDPAAPLLVSVRSGARASMPGMMDTILNLGLNESIAQAMIARTNNPRFVWDAYRRFIAMYGDIVLGVHREHFEGALDDARRTLARARGVNLMSLNSEELKQQIPDHQLSEDALRGLVTAFKGLVREHAKIEFPDDPREQLWGAIGAVFRSWNNDRAISYRKIHHIPDDWGTACNVQAMVFGNTGDTSATGVCFTRDPRSGEKRFFGEWLPNAQGEDVVAGTRTPFGISREAAGDASLEARMPAAYADLVRIYQTLEKHYRDMLDIEFTIEDAKLWMLQCRVGGRSGRAAVRLAVEMAREGMITPDEAVLRVPPSKLDELLHPTLDPTAPRDLLAKGLPAGPGAATGRVVFHADDAEKLARDGHPVILVRRETSPEDVHGMQAAAGILTARGGMTSHAAVVARILGRCCVAGCSAVQVDYAKATMTVSRYDEHDKVVDQVVVREGETITLFVDDRAGYVYRGAIAMVPASTGGDLETLMHWADAARRLKVRANADRGADARIARALGAEGIGLCRTEHMFFEPDRIGVVRQMIVADTVEERQAALAKLLPVQRGDFVALFREMRALPVTIRLLDPPLHEFLPTDDEQFAQLATLTGLTLPELRRRTDERHEMNPMLGHRGVRLAITYPEIYEMQVRAILEAACDVAADGVEVHPEIMVPLSAHPAELAIVKEMVERVAADVFSVRGRTIPYLYGTMIELPRAALVAGALARTAEFFSFGTNDLTQTTWGLSRDDAGRFLPAYLSHHIVARDPFQTLDVDGVGELVRTACERGRAARAGIKLGVCGEHGGDPESITFFEGVGLDYVSCAPFRVPIARLAAAQASLLRHRNTRASSSSV